ncbi:MAG: putative Ig domain-containing protein [Blastocatellales bacterium]
MHTANRLSRLSSSSGKLKQLSYFVLPGLFVIFAFLGASLTEARRGDGAASKDASAMILAPTSAVAAATITVNDTADSVGNDGKCTLREAIIAANTNMASGAAGGECVAGMAGADNIVFNLGTGTPTINLTSALPTISEPVTINGNTGGATRVELNGIGAGANVNGLTINAGSSVIERLVINRFTGDGIRITGGGFNTIKGCIIGLDSSGTIARANNVGLAIRGSSDNTIGSAQFPDRNTISGNTTNGVLITPVTITNPPPNPPTVIPASRNKIINTYIGSDVTGRFDLGNTGFGVNVSGGDATVIGGAIVEERNLISGNNGGGVRIGTSSATNNRVIGNYIGTDYTGVMPLGNGVSGGGGTAPGVWIEDAPNNSVGGALDGEFNFIKFNLQSGGVVVTGSSATGNSILRNYISNNAGLGIDLGGNGVTGNDPFDGDSGPNNLQNSPSITGVSLGNTTTTIFGSLSSQSLQSYRIEFFLNSQCDPSGSGEGETYIGFTNVSTDLLGGASFSPTFNDFVAPAGAFLTATATKLTGSQDTSEFSGCFTVPGPGPSTCDAVFTPPSLSFLPQGGTASINVILAGSCAWTATSNLPWVSIQSGASGTGNGTVVVNVASNSGNQRLGQITIAGKNYEISQQGPCTASLNPVVRNFTAAGGTSSVELITGSGCAWTVSNANSWITINTATSGTGPTFVQFTVDPYAGTTTRIGLITIAGQSLAVIQDQPCGATINPTFQMVPAGGGSFSTSLTIPAGCNWTAVPTDPWIVLTSATSGMGNATIQYSIGANSGQQRAGAIMVAGKSLAISQDSGCQPTFNPMNQSIGSGAGSHSFNVSIGAACNWTPTTSTPWITITSPSRTGNGSVNYTVTANPGSQRVGSISVSGQNFAVTQDGACSYLLSKTIQQFAVQGGTDSVNVTAPGGCSWMATTNTPWIVITSGASGSGNGTVNYLVTTNGTGSQRAGVMNIAGINYTVQQDGGCTYTVSPLTQNVPSSGGGFTTSVTTAGGCAWTASSNVPWITITSSLLPDRDNPFPNGRNLALKNAIAGTGNGTVGYSVAPNTGPPRSGTLFAAGELVTVNQASGCPINVSPANLSAGQIGVNYNQQFTQSGGVGAITWSVSSGSLPPGMMLNPGTGLLSGIPTVPASFNFTIRATDINSCYGETSYLLVINCQPLNITPTSLPNGTAGTVYNQQLTLTGGTGATDWSVSAGSLPGGLSLNPASGVLSGIPQVTGPFNFTVKGTVNSTGCFATRAYSLTIGCQSITVNEASLSAATLNTSYNQTLTQTGGIGGITWSLSGGSLPANLMLSPAGVISGTPTVTGSFPITVRATDGNNCFGEKAFNLVVNCPAFDITPAALPQGTRNSSYSQQLSQTGASGSVTWTLSGGSLPSNLTLSSGGLISGTPSVAGSFPITVRATDSSNGCFTDKAYTLVINCQAISVTPTTLNPGNFGTNYSQQLSQSGGISTITWSVSAGSLPNGVGLSTSGLLSGIPTAVGTFNFTARATDASGCFGERAYQLLINCQSLSISPSTLSAIPIAMPYSQQLTLTGGAGATDWSITAGALPSGVTLNPTTGLLSGSPNVSGTFNFTAKATLQATACFAQQAYTLVVNCPTINVSPATLNQGYLGSPYSQQFSQTGGAGSIFWSLSSGSLPNNMSLSGAGLLSGTPVMSGNYPITVRATDSNGCFGEKSYNLQISSCPVITITPNTLPDALLNNAYNQALAANGGTPGYTFTVGSGLPAGLTLSPAGVLSGSPQVIGTYNFTVTATDQGGCTGTKNYTLSICSDISINPPSLPGGFVGTPYNQMLTATGGNPAYSFSFNGTLPDGLSLSPTGLLSGTPTTMGVFNFTVSATDVNSCVGSRSYTVAISSNGLVYYPLPYPIRLFDTRAAIPGFQACEYLNQPLIANGELVKSGRINCNGVIIPATAQAITGNATVVAPSANGYLTMWPDGQTRPPVSTLNYLAGQTTANAFTIGLSQAGNFKTYSFAATHFIVDVTGYFAPPSTGGLYYHPLPHPIRLFDTRAPIPGFQGCEYLNQPLIGGAELAKQARISCNGVTIPADAMAIVGNSTVVNPTGNGYVTLWPDGQTRPPVSNLNYLFGETKANAFTVALGANGQFRTYSNVGTDFLVDVVGYYSPSSVDVNGTGLLFSPLTTPIRLFDTRAAIPGFPACEYLNQSLGDNSELAKQARVTCGGVTIPANAQSIVGNATAIGPVANGFITLWPDGQTRPPVSNLNYQTGQTAANAFTVGLAGDGMFRIYTARATHFLIDVSGYFAP